ncbi:MAG: glucosaminidase domain-containing protein [Nitrososphaerota archaeon]
MDLKLSWLVIKEILKNIGIKFSEVPMPKKLFSKSTMKKTKEEEFVSNLNILKDLGWDPYIPYTHAWHESGQFKKVIGEYNFWGIKRPSKWEGKEILVLTHEYINGKKVKVTDKFIDFYNIQEALLWYDSFIRRIYKISYANRNNYVNFFSGLVSGPYKYATDPNYAKKLTELYVTLKNSGRLEKISNA